jgi:hypothetical protein
MCARGERFTESAMRSEAGRDVSTAGEGRQLSSNKRGGKRTAHEAVPSHIATGLVRGRPRATLAIVGARATCEARTAAPPLALYNISSKPNTKGDSNHDVPWERQVSAKPFVGDVSCERSATPADKCGEAQRGDSSARGLIIWDGISSFL